MLIADAQIHLWTNDQAPPHHRQKALLADEAIALMDAAGIDRAINCPAIWDSGSNEYALTAARAFPDRFATMGWFDLAMKPDREFLEAFLDREDVLGLRFVIMRPDDVMALAEGRFDWIWEVADRRAAPVALMLPSDALGQIGRLAIDFPSVRFMIDHLAISPFDKGTAALEHLPQLVCLAARDNVAIKATAVPGIATDPYPHYSIHTALEALFHAYGASRFFWGTNITRMSLDWRQCAQMFTEHLRWLRGSDLEKVMGYGLCQWTGWKI